VNQLLFAILTWWRTRRGFDVVHSHENTWHGQIQTVHVRPTRYNLFHARTGVALAMRWLKVGLSLRLITYVRLEAARFAPRPGRQVVATSQTLREECEAAYPASSSLLSVITPGTLLPDDGLSRAQARETLGLLPTASYLLFVANDFARKGLTALLQALVHLPDSVRLMVVGDTRQVARFTALAEQLAVQDRVAFLGSRTDMSEVYLVADLLIHPTLEDSFAMVVLEAMAHRLPVVVSGPDHCGISRQLQSGREAMLLTDPTDAAAMAEVLLQLLGSAPLREQLVQNAWSFAQQHTWERAGLAYEALYRQALEGTRP
jgi:glycosyltransferase involved in cell wall biosynthesis